MRQYADMISNSAAKKQQLQQQMRKAHLYSEIYRDMVGILNILLPNDKALEISLKIKSILYNTIELQTGKRPDKF